MNSDTIPTDICDFSQSQWFQKHGWSKDLHYIYWYRLYNKKTGSCFGGPFNIIASGIYSDTDLDLLMIPYHKDAVEMFRNHGISISIMYISTSKTWKYFVVYMETDIYRKYHNKYVEIMQDSSGYTYYDNCMSAAINAAMDLYDAIDKNDKQ